MESSDKAIYIWIAKFGWKLTMWLYISIKMANQDKKLLRNTLSLAKLDDKRILVDFYHENKGVVEE